MIRKTGIHMYRICDARKIMITLLLLFALSHADGVVAHEADQHDSKQQNSVAITERLGSFLPERLVFLDEKGERFPLDSRIDKPTIILPIFFHCSEACDLQTAALVTALRKMEESYAAEYRTLVISFDPDDTIRDAQKKRKNLLHLSNMEQPFRGWSFLKGDPKTINRFLSGIGFQLKRIGKHNFVHPNGLVVVAPDRKIIRYLYGPRYLPFDLAMALTEASEGTPGISIRKALTYCFSYDREEKAYVFQSFRMFGILIPAVLFLFYLLFLRQGNRKTKDTSMDNQP